MDRGNLVESLQKAFNEDDRIRNTNDIDDVEYKEDTNTLYVNEQKTYNMQMKAPEVPAMSEEEIFARLRNERR